MERKRSGFQIMSRLIKELKPLASIMLITITMGVFGFLAAISITSFGAVAIGTIIGDITFISFKYAIVIMVLCAILRGTLRYIEQLSGHYIAFKILYIMRDKIFTKLRSLEPGRLEGKEKGSLISIITSDIELLEVFYAHTIAPISIAIITNSIISVVLYKIRPIFGILAIIFFIIVGFIIPYASSSMGKSAGAQYRNLFGKCNNYILDSLRGLKEVLLFKAGNERLEGINAYSHEINESLDNIKKHEGIIRATTDITIMIAILSFVGIGFYEYSKGNISFTWMLVVIVIIASSFGPVVALSNLSNTLLQTFACAERLFDLLDEEAKVKEVADGQDIDGETIEYKHVDFSYPNREEKIFNNMSMNINRGEKVALIGDSGVGKSTFVKLMMRFWYVNRGELCIDNVNIKDINTSSLRESETLVSQETYLFNESILDNIKIGNTSATKAEVVEAAKKAAIHDFIETLPKGYDTKVGELGGLLSSGEKQRLGLARSFLSSGEILILDEPTSNLDTLNESLVLKSIKENCEHKTIILISHRKSTTSISNKVFRVEEGKLVKES